MSTERSEHCVPEVLMDLTEGAPVDARARQHVASCESCAASVAELRGTLDELGDAESPEPPVSYWRDFRARLSTRIEMESESARRRRGLRWAISAAAVVSAILVGRAFLPEIPAPANEPTTSLLPPIDEDAEFQFLESVAGLVEPGEDWDALSSGLSGLATGSDLASLTAQEETLLADRLRKVLENKSDAKS